MKHRARAASCQQGKLCVDSGKMNKKYKLGVLKLLKIWKDYYLDASSVYYTLKKAHAKADGGVEYDIWHLSCKAGGGAGRSCKTHDP